MPLSNRQAAFIKIMKNSTAWWIVSTQYCYSLAANLHKEYATWHVIKQSNVQKYFFTTFVLPISLNVHRISITHLDKNYKLLTSKSLVSSIVQTKQYSQALPSVTK